MKGLEVSSCKTKPPAHSLKQERGTEPAAPARAHLQPDHVDQRLVGDVDLTQDLCDGHSGDEQVERHKQREDRGQPAGKRGWGAMGVTKGRSFSLAG